MKDYGFRSMLNGVLWQQKDNSTETAGDMKPVTERIPRPESLKIWYLRILL